MWLSILSTLLLGAQAPIGLGGSPQDFVVAGEHAYGMILPVQVVSGAAVIFSSAPIVRPSHSAVTW